MMFLSFGWFALLLLVFFGPVEAHAYLDPGSGSVVLQTLLAVAAGVYMFFKYNFLKVRDFFRWPGAPKLEKPSENPQKSAP